MEWNSDANDSWDGLKIYDFVSNATENYTYTP